MTTGAWEKAYHWLARQNYLPLVLLSAIAILAGFPLKNTLWLDETITLWVVRDGFPSLIERARDFQGQSPLYFLFAWISTSLFGPNEVALRIPSLLAAFGTALVIYRLAARFYDLEYGAAALLILLSTDGFVKATVNARPYSVALFFASASILALARLEERPSPARALILVALTAAAFYTHYFFLGIVAVQIAWLACGRFKTVPLTSLAICAILLALACFPGFAHMLEVARKPEIYDYHHTRLPSPMDLAKAILPPALLVYCLCGLALARIQGPFRIMGSWPIREKLPALAIWYLLPPLLFFAVSHIGGNTLFYWRFYVWYAPALALILGFALRAIEHPSARAAVLCSFTALHVLVPRAWYLEDWKRASAILRAETSGKPDTPILFYSGLIELEARKNLDDPAKRDYLLSPLEAYNVTAPAIPLPSGFYSPEMEEYFQTKVLPIIQHRREILLICQSMHQFSNPDPKARVPEYFETRLVELGFKSKHLLDRGSVKVIRFAQEG